MRKFLISLLRLLIEILSCKNDTSCFESKYYNILELNILFRYIEICNKNSLEFTSKSLMYKGYNTAVPPITFNCSFFIN